MIAKTSSTSFIWETGNLKNFHNKIIEKIQKEEKIDKTVREIIKNSPEKQDFTLLRKERANEICHVPVGGLKENVFFCNMKHIGLAPTPLCLAYNKMRVPTLSSYHSIGSNIATIQLDSSSLKYVPKEVREKIGDISNNPLELFWTAVDGRWFKETKKLNLCTHPWSYPHALPGDNVSEDILMGIFPEVGFKPIDKSNDTYPIGCYQLGPMQVHSHPKTEKKTGSHEEMLYSPNNAHFEHIVDAPFGVFWSVTQKNERVAITKMLVLFDYKHPICVPLIDSIRKSSTLSDHLEQLDKGKQAISGFFKNVIELFSKNDERAMKEFNQLPLTFQYGIFKEAWILFGSLVDIHRDFGKASFEGDNSLNEDYRCSNEQRIQAIQNYAAYLEHLLIGSQDDLLLHSQPLVKGENGLKMMRCAELLLSKQKEAMNELFQSLTQEEKEAVYFFLWDLSGSPRGNKDFGKQTFENPETNPALLAEAFLFASTRVKPTSNQEIVIEQNKEREDVSNKTPQGLEALTNLVYSEGFPSLQKGEQHKLINSLLNELPLKTKNEIYGKIYELSVDLNKGGDSWAEKHVADDLNLLIGVVSDL